MAVRWREGRREEEWEREGWNDGGGRWKEEKGKEEEEQGGE